MKPFRFSLERVLNVRHLQTTVAKQALASAQLAVQEARTELDRARVTRTAFEADWEDRRVKGMRAGAWADASQNQEALIAAASSAADRLHSRLEALAERREDLVEAQRREKTLEKVRDQQWEIYEYALRATEQAETDEIARGTGHPRKGVV